MKSAHVGLLGSLHSTLHDAIKAQLFLCLFGPLVLSWSAQHCLGCNVPVLHLGQNLFFCWGMFFRGEDTVLVAYQGKATLLQHPNETQIL